MKYSLLYHGMVYRLTRKQNAVASCFLWESFGPSSVGAARPCFFQAAKGSSPRSKSICTSSCTSDASQAAELSLEYILGLFETDGCFQILFKKDNTMRLGYRVHPVAIFSQADERLLEMVRNKLQQNQIKTRYQKNSNSRTRRADNLIISGILEVRKFLELLASAKASMHGIKWIDYSIMKALFAIIDQNRHNTAEGRLEIIDLKYHMHAGASWRALSETLTRHTLEVPEGLETKARPEVPEVPSKGEGRSSCCNEESRLRKQREVWTQRHGLKAFETKSPGMVKNSTIKQIYKSYELHKENTMALLANCERERHERASEQAAKITLKAPSRTGNLTTMSSVSGDYISGLIEGDGCITFHIRLYKNTVNIEPSLRVTVERGGSLILEVLANYFEDSTKFHLKSSRTKGGGACVYWSTNKEVLRRLLVHADKHPIFGKKGQIEVLRSYLRLYVDERQFKPKVEEIEELIKLIYRTAPCRKNRKMSLLETLAEVRARYFF